MTIVEFLNASYDTDETVLIRYRDGHPEPHVNYEGQDPANYDEYDSCARCIAVAEATPYRDVEFGLADIAAKRATLNRLDQLRDHLDARGLMLPDRFTAETVQGIVFDLALPYAGRDGYDESWRPA